MRVRRHQWVVAGLIVVISILYGYRESLDIAPWYSAKVTLRLHPDRLNLVPGDAGGVSSEEDMRQLLTTIAEASISTAISKRVIEANDLLSNVDFAGPMATTNSMARLARSLSGQTWAKTRNETWLIDLRVNHGKRELAKDLANWVGAAVVEQQNVVLGYDPENELVRGSERALPPLSMVVRAHSASNQAADPAAKIFTSALFGLIIAAFVVWFWVWRPPRQENGKAAAAA